MNSDWRPSASPRALLARAAMLAAVRDFFARAGVLEVETPIASRCAGSDPALESLVTRWHWGSDAAGQPLYLHTSPEFPMKRLVAAGLGPIYQICKVFRDGERGRLHHPEFSLLEWYRPGWDYRRLMDEVTAVVRVVLGRPDFPTERVTYRGLFRERLGIDPWTAGCDDLRARAATLGIPDAVSLDLDRDGWLDLLLTQCLQGQLGRGRLTFLCDYPPSQAALARLRQDDVEVAERFELYLEGVELANGFQELTDAAAQRARLQSDLETRRRQGRAVPPLDTAFLAALDAGMPETSGVAVGLDRLLMAVLEVRHIDAVLAFPVERA
ncbi:EF-P lysine aminoacylase EpmA [Lamprocystis purpurea]|uniref:EF-P lysine aminoacylase EpmA n=1 Tax=Lamprocystis purpurea TaxID=61598 RepID=UPI000361DB60|nr:EF-P lysine aminoacylase EpmA [Lamprocystis purpurea]